MDTWRLSREIHTSLETVCGTDTYNVPQMFPDVDLSRLMDRMTLVAYMAHPLGERPDDVYDNQQRINLSNGLEWVRFLKATTSWAVCYPSFVYVASDHSTLSQPRSLTDQIAILGICDLYVLVGGVMNPHMRIELRIAKTKKKPIVDLLYLGRVPPWDEKDRVSLEIERIAEEAGVAER